MFEGKTVVITGASSGLGSEIARTFAGLKANLVLCGRDRTRLTKVSEECVSAGSEPLIISADITNSNDCKKLVEQTVERFGNLDYLVANAGISMWANFEDVKDLTLFRKLIDTNYLGVVNCVHHALPHLRQSRGMIVAISSIQGKIGVPLHTGYVASKHALQGFCDALRTEVASSGVGVLVVMPHWLRGTKLRENAFGADGRKLGGSSAKHTGESISLEECTRKIVRAMKKRKRELVIPPKLKLLPWVRLLFPAWLDRLVSKKVSREK